MLRTTARLGTLTGAFLLISLTAAAQGKKKGDKKPEAEADKPATTMESGGTDPAETETLEKDAPFVPGNKPPKTESTTEEGEDADLDPDREKEEEEEEEQPPAPIEPADKKIGISGEALVGFGTAPVQGTSAVPDPDFTSMTFLLGVRYDVIPKLRIGARFAWSTATFDNASGDSESHAAFANPELSVRYRLNDAQQTVWALRLAVGVPVGQGTLDPTANVADPNGTAQGGVQLAAESANGRRDPELFMAERLPVSFGGLVAHRASALLVTGEAKVVVGFDTGDRIVEDDVLGQGTSYKKSSVAFIPVLGGGASYDVLAKMAAGLDAWASYYIARPVEFESSATEAPRFQLVLEPRISAKLGAVSPSIGFLVPVGGELGGNVNALRLKVDILL